MLKKSKLRDGAAPRKLGHGSPSGSPALAASLAEGLKHHQAGRLAEAEKIYVQILTVQPGHFDGRQLLGAIFLQRGNHTEALRHIKLALKRSPDNVLS